MLAQYDTCYGPVSVRMSVRPAQASVLSKRLNIDAYNHAHNAKDPFTRYNLLSNPLSNPLSTGFTTGCIVYTNIQPVVKPV